MRATLEDEVPYQVMKPTKNNQPFQKELEEQGRLSMVTADTHLQGPGGGDPPENQLRGLTCTLWLSSPP